MFEPVRGGTRGGQAEFKWTDVSADKDRENYLGHSINAPTGRWQKNKDVHWYSRDLTQAESERVEEVRKIKELEADALAVALGFEPAPKTAKPSESVASSQDAAEGQVVPSEKAAEKEERRRRKAERKEEKRARKELKRLHRSGVHDGDGELHDDGHRRSYRSSRSRSPRPRVTERQEQYSRRPRSRTRSRSRTPVRERPGRRMEESRYGPYERHGRIDSDRRRDR